MRCSVLTADMLLPGREWGVGHEEPQPGIEYVPRARYESPLSAYERSRRCPVMVNVFELLCGVGA